MVEFQHLEKGIGFILFLIAILSPSAYETEFFGIGEVYMADAIFMRFVFVGFLWAIESTHTSSLLPTPDTQQIIFPYIQPLTLLIASVAVVSAIISILIMSEKINFSSGTVTIAVLTLLLVILPGLIVSRVEETYTYRIIPIPITQIVSLVTLGLFTLKKQRVE